MRFYPKGAFTAAPPAPTTQFQIQQQLQPDQILSQTQQVQQFQQSQPRLQQRVSLCDIDMGQEVLQAAPWGFQPVHWAYALCSRPLLAHPAWCQPGFGCPIF